MALETSAESPVPVRTVLQLVGGWITRLGRIWVEGQITELNRRAGTVYFTRRDPVANVSVRVVCPRVVCDGAGPSVVDGARVVVHAKPDFYVNRGSFALSAVEIKPVGVGELLARLERLKGLLTAEGLFRSERKRPLPFLPGRVGLICGRDSAAERDVLDNARRRWPAVRFTVENTAVQGSYAVAEIMEALRMLDGDPAIDVIIIARGGGSLEDLLPFSDEALVRAVAAARTPVVSAIGHEQDAPLLDHVADVRASTPTDAAQKVVPDVREQAQIVRQLRDRARRCLLGRVERELARRCLSGALDAAVGELSHTRARLTSLSPAATLERGYAIVQRPDDTVVLAAADVAIGDELLVRFADGRITATAGGPADDDTAAGA